MAESEHEQMGHHFRWRFALYGALFGICFPIFGTALQSYVQFGAVSWANLLQSQANSQLLWIIDTAPFFLGLFAFFGGVQLDRVAYQNEELSRKYDEMDDLRKVADEANQAKSSFLANMSHEIRTPMNAIIGMTYLSLKENLSAQQRNRMQKIQQSSESLMRIINDILDFSKIEAGETSFESSSFRLETVVNDVAEVVNVKLRQKDKLEFIIDYDPKIPVLVKSDPLRIRQILLNLLDNAVKFTDAGEVKLTCRLKGSHADGVHLHFSVRDTGIGIRPEQITRLFSPFQQADVTTTRKFGGTGLGLTICKSLVAMLGGNLTVESVSGEGSTFAFDAVLGRAELNEERTFGTENLDGLKVLLVDDSESARWVLREMLESFKFQVHEAKSGQEAVQLYEASLSEPDGYALIVTDWRMPEMDGLEMMTQIRRVEGGDSPCVLMVTAYGAGLVRQSKKEMLIDGYLTKPVSPSQLFDAIQQALYQRGPDKVKVVSDDVETARDQLQGLRVLVVEDNEINTELVVALLEDVGLLVDTARNGREAIERVNDKTYAGILMDIQMPEMDGLMATRELRRMGHGDLPIVAMTAHALEGERQKSLDAGMNEHITKPISPAVLYRTMIDHFNLDSPRVEPGGSIDIPAHLAPSDELIPAIDGLDINRVLERLGGKTALYRQLLEGFVDNYLNFAAVTHRYVRTDDIDGLFRLIHTVVGTLGNIGATDLHGEGLILSGRLKQGFCQEQDIEQAQAISVRVEALAQRIASAIETEDVNPATITLVPMAPDMFRALIGHTVEATKAADPSATQAFENALEQFSLPHHAAEVMAALSALDQMEFDDALRHLEKVKFDE